MTNPPKLWSKEYKQKGIPSSFRQKPSGAMKLLSIANLKGKTIADLGCGKGRNTFYLIKNGASKVYAIDFVPEAIREIKSAKNPKITAVCRDLAKPWPIPSDSLNLTIDIFCFKHQASLKNQEFYKSEIERTLKKKGLLLLDLAAVDDGFYGIQPKKEIKPNVYKITDPVTGVNSLLYTKESLLTEFPNFELLDFTNDKKEGQMHGQTYSRSTLKFLLKKN
ncbi:MAG: methyltransferase domain-containing protein [Patescibacteria group bacterium]